MNRYDVVVMGAGAAGALLAARLSEDPGSRVLLVDAGPDVRTTEAFPPRFSMRAARRGLHRRRHLTARRIIIPTQQVLRGSGEIPAA